MFCSSSLWNFSVCHFPPLRSKYSPQHCVLKGTAVAQWLRCCATKRKVAGSIPDGVLGIFHWHNPPDRTMALDSASNRNEYQENFLWVNAAGAWGCQTYHLPVPLSLYLGILTFRNPLGHSRPVTGLIFHFYCVFTLFITILLLMALEIN